MDLLTNLLTKLIVKKCKNLKHIDICLSDDYIKMAKSKSMLRFLKKMKGLSKKYKLTLNMFHKVSSGYDCIFCIDNDVILISNPWEWRI